MTPKLSVGQPVFTPKNVENAPVFDPVAELRRLRTILDEELQQGLETRRSLKHFPQLPEFDETDAFSDDTALASKTANTRFSLRPPESAATNTAGRPPILESSTVGIKKTISPLFEGVFEKTSPFGGPIGPSFEALHTAARDVNEPKISQSDFSFTGSADTTETSAASVKPLIENFESRGGLDKLKSLIHANSIELTTSKRSAPGFQPRLFRIDPAHRRHRSENQQVYRRNPLFSNELDTSIPLRAELDSSVDPVVPEQKTQKSRNEAKKKLTSRKFSKAETVVIRSGRVARYVFYLGWTILIIGLAHLFRFTVDPDPGFWLLGLRLSCIGVAVIILRKIALLFDGRQDSETVSTNRV